MKTLLLSAIAVIFVFYNLMGANSITSPDGKIEIQVTLTDHIYYNVSRNGEILLWQSPLGMTLSNNTELGYKPNLINSKTTSVSEKIKPVWGIRSEIDNAYNELRLDFEGNYSLLFRAYNDGVAYRFETRLKGTIEVKNELVEYRFTSNFPVVAHVVGDLQSSYEKTYTFTNIDQIKETDFSTLPFVIKQPSARLAIVESDVYDYPGMYIMKKGENNRPWLNGLFAAYPTKTEPGGWCQFNLRVVERADYIARTNGTRSFPWRAMVIVPTDKELADNDLVYKLARPANFETSWIRPGKVAWEWWNDWNLEGVDFETGVNNKTYEYYIDFAAKNNLEYVIMDEGWSDQFDLLLQKPNVDVPYLAKYAADRNVKLILWCVWYVLDRQMEEAFSLFEKWGIAGVKVDFIDRDDQVAINFYERLAREAAKHKLLVDIHGCSKPTGLHRTYPNVINYEAVRGNEYNKFSTGETPDHNVNLVFTRMIAGPMDYTPGAMRNSIEGDFKPSNSATMSYGTRCHQLGMYVCYYAPLQMLCDAPTAYEKEPKILALLSEVPVTWDDTKVIAGEIGSYAVIARRKGNDWYIGALNNWTERSITIDLSFIQNGDYQGLIIKDGINANRNAEDYAIEQKLFKPSGTLELLLKKGGGALIQLKKI